MRNLLTVPAPFELIRDFIRDEDEQRARARDLQRMHKLLECAPVDRAWHRRGLLVLCHGFPDQARIGLANNPVVGGSRME